MKPEEVEGSMNEIRALFKEGTPDHIIYLALSRAMRRELDESIRATAEKVEAAVEDGKALVGIYALLDTLFSGIKIDHSFVILKAISAELNMLKGIVDNRIAELEGKPTDSWYQKGCEHGQAETEGAES